MKRFFIFTPVLFMAIHGFTADLAVNERDNHTVLDEVVVYSSPLNQTLFEQSQPVSVLSGQELQLELAPTLGETLSRTPGVSSSYFGPAASRPVIRGLDADRVSLLQNGVNTIDASEASADHAVSFDPVSLDSIEVVRGPATLLYGSSAIGGVVNALDNRIPDERIEVPARGTIEGNYGSVNTERGAAFTLEGGFSGFNYHIEGYKRATEDLHIPGYARSERLRRLEPLEDGEKESNGILPNSDLRTEGLSGGASYVWDGGYFGLAYSGFHSNYGTVAEPEVTIDMEQRRWDFQGAFTDPFEGLKSIKYSLGISDYEHTEFEGQETGTRFENEGYDGRIEVAHHKLGMLEGAVGFQTQRSNFSALGEEAFLPPTDTTGNSVFVFEELVLNPQWKLQLGARFDHITVDAAAAEGFGPSRGRSFDNLSGSAGLIYSPNDTYAVALNLALTQRAPTSQELYANGPHIATNAFEVGDDTLGSEKAFSMDLSLRKKEGWVTGSLTGFYYRFSDFIGEFATGELFEDEEGSLPVYAYSATDAEFFGGEAELVFHLLEPQVASDGDHKDGKTVATAKDTQTLDLILKADYVHATDLGTGDPLPRIPPFRTMVGLNYQWNHFRAGVEGQFAAHQNRVSEFELETDSYFLLNANMSYKLPLRGVDVDIYIKGVNLTDSEARLHTSFLKDIAPLGGRGVVAGFKATF